jgi:hypothetical protein
MWPAAVVQHAATGLMLQPIYNLNSLLSERWNTSVAPGPIRNHRFLVTSYIRVPSKTTYTDYISLYDFHPILGSAPVTETR